MVRPPRLPLQKRRHHTLAGISTRMLNPTIGSLFRTAYSPLDSVTSRKEAHRLSNLVTLATHACRSRVCMQRILQTKTLTTYLDQLSKTLCLLFHFGTHTHAFFGMSRTYHKAHHSLMDDIGRRHRNLAVVPSGQHYCRISDSNEHT